MGCVKTNLRAARLKKKYPLVRNLPRPAFVASGNAGVENLIVQIEDSDTVSFTFSSPFPETPSIVASFISANPVGNVNVFIETASASGATLRTSAVTTGIISVHAMYIEGCTAQDYSFAPILISPPVLGPALVGNNLSLTPPVLLGNPSP